MQQVSMMYNVASDLVQQNDGVTTSARYTKKSWKSSAISMNSSASSGVCILFQPVIMNPFFLFRDISLSGSEPGAPFFPTLMMAPGKGRY